MRTDRQHGPGASSPAGGPSALLTRLGRLALPPVPNGGPPPSSHVAPDAALQDIAHLALAHGLGGTFYTNVRGTAAESQLPEALRRQLRATYLSTATCTAARLLQLAEVERVLAAEAVPHVRLKGAALVGDLYDDPGHRPMSDVDLLVTPDDIPAAAQALAALGYRPVDEAELYPAGRAARRTYHVQLVRDSPTGDLLELHWDMTQPEGLLRHIQLDVPGILAQRRGLRPSPEDELLLLAIHFGRHYLRGLMWAADIALYVERHSATLRWDRLVSRARDAGAAHLLHTVLAACIRVFGSRGAAPAAVCHALRPGWIRRTALDAVVTPRHLLATAPGPRALKLLIPDTMRASAATAWWAMGCQAVGSVP